MELKKQRQGYLPHGTVPGTTGSAQTKKYILFHVALSLGWDKKTFPMLKPSTE